MAIVTALIAAANDNQSRLELTYDDASLGCASLSWTNPSGHWTFVLTRQPSGQQITRTLNPGDSGSLNFPNGWSWAIARGAHPNFDFAHAWTSE